MRIVVLGLTLSSSWGNGHATTYRALIAALAARGHDVLFLEREKPWYAAARDLVDPSYCRLAFYDELAGLEAHRPAIAAADLVVVGSYVPDGVVVGDWAIEAARGVVAFYDIDTPVTLARLEAGGLDYLSPALIPRYDLYLSFTGGPTLDVLERRWRARRARAFYCAVDPALYRPVEAATRWDLGYLGTYSDDRQPTLERLLIDPARARPDLRFVVAGPQYPDTIDWPANVERIEHVGPADHAEFYSSLRWTLNVTRADMRAAGYSPSVRLFEAAACGCPIVSDRWAGIEAVLRPGHAVALADTADDVLTVLGASHEVSRVQADTARSHVLRSHTASHRAAELERHVAEAARVSRPARIVRT